MSRKQKPPPFSRVVYGSFPLDTITRHWLPEQPNADLALVAKAHAKPKIEKAKPKPKRRYCKAYES